MFFFLPNDCYTLQNTFFPIIMQKTLILLKPDCVTNRVCGKVISRFEEAGFTINACKMINLSKEILRDHYSHIASKPFYPEVEEFMMAVSSIEEFWFQLVKLPKSTG